jgi:beta-N-acetylhexosaminidase
VRRILTLKASAGLLQEAPGGNPVHWQQHQDLAYQVGLRAVTMFRNEENLIPIPRQKHQIQVIGPITEDFEFFYQQIEGELLSSGFQVSQELFPMGDKQVEAKPKQIDAILSKASRTDLIILFTYQAHLLKIQNQDTWQIRLGNQLLATGKPVIMVALRSPTDLLEFPQSKTYLATFGTTQGQLDMLVQTLVHGQIPVGINPLPELK